MPSLLDILGYAGNVLDLPGSSLRDLLSGNNPFDQWATPFSSDNRASGRDVLQPLLGANEETGMSGWLDNPVEGVKDLAGFGFEMAADPLNFVSMAPVFRALKGRKAAKTANKAERAASKGRYGFVNTRVVADDMLGVPQSAVPTAVENPMAAGPKLLGYTPAPESWRYPGRETMRHGGYPWDASATAEHPYGMFDINYKGIGEGGQMYGPGFYKADVDPTSEHYRDLVQRRMDAKSTPIDSIRQTAIDMMDNGDRPSTWGDFSAAVRAAAMREQSPLNEHIFKILDHVDSLPMRDVPSPFGGGGVPWGQVHPYDEILNSPNSIRGKLLDEVSSMEAPPGLWESSLVQHNQKARLYTIDAPAGTKDRYMDWDNPISDQPQAVQDIVSNPMNVLDEDTYKGLTDMFAAAEKARVLKQQANQMERELGIFIDLRDTPAYTPEVKAAAKEKYDAYVKVTDEEEFYDIFARDLHAQMARRGLPHDLLEKAFHFKKPQPLEQAWKSMDGETVADLLMGNHPSDANLADAARLREAGVPGMKNDSHLSPGTKNYVTWDPELIKQFRIRKIDGQDVPINPMFGPVKTEQRVIPQIADADMLETINPMSLQPLPGLAKPMMQGAAYQALARFNAYGGSL